MKYNPLTIAHKFITKNFPLLFAVSFFLGIFYYFVDLILDYFIPVHLSLTGMNNFLALYFNNLAYLNIGLVFGFFLKLIIASLFTALIFTVLVRFLNIDLKQILVKYRQSPEQLQNTANYKSKFTPRLVLNFIYNLGKLSFAKTYLRVLSGLLVFALASFALSLPLIGIVKAVYASSIASVIFALIAIIILILNAGIYVPWLGISVTSKSAKVRDLFILSSSIFSQFFFVVLIFLVNYFVISVVLEFAFIAIRSIAEFIRLGLAGDFLVYALVVLKYVYLVVFSIALYFVYISFKDKSEVENLVSEGIYIQDFNIAKTTTARYTKRITNTLNYQTNNDSKVNYGAVSKSKAEPEKKSEDVDLAHLSSEKKKSKSGFFANLFKRKAKVSQSTFEHVDNAQVQFDSDKITPDNNPFDLENKK
ncbi:hypothetical protein CJP74_06265 [Psittacicella melopsittaci]|uniref:Transmembrane protein n=1 Tax=Psittacicella melopsittaci TaxID=2028576 RepID=A0A3A1Y0K2_9GAMM|nr:hypothetical protein [Psittacicella melopsittaci]RIY31773.1 hypothetical protein CJP74_06265 [Psittacicella melopsittaci]